MLRHSQVQLEKNEKLQGIRYEKQLQNQVNWISKCNMLLHFKCASMKSSSYRFKKKMFPNVIKKKNPEMMSLKDPS